MAVKNEGAAVKIAAHLGRLADAQVAQLHFLEIRIDPQGIQRDHGHQRLSGLNVLPSCTLRSAT